MQVVLAGALWIATSASGRVNMSPPLALPDRPLYVEPHDLVSERGSPTTDPASVHGRAGSRVPDSLFRNMKIRLAPKKAMRESVDPRELRPRIIPFDG